MRYSASIEADLISIMNFHEKSLMGILGTSYEQQIITNEAEIPVLVLIHSKPGSFARRPSPSDMTGRGGLGCWCCWCSSCTTPSVPTVDLTQARWFVSTASGKLDSALAGAGRPPLFGQLRARP